MRISQLACQIHSRETGSGRAGPRCDTGRPLAQSALIDEDDGLPALVWLFLAPAIALVSIGEWRVHSARARPAGRCDSTRARRGGCARHGRREGDPALAFNQIGHAPVGPQRAAIPRRLGPDLQLRLDTRQVMWSEPRLSARPAGSLQPDPAPGRPPCREQPHHRQQKSHVFDLTTERTAT
jgi:hypothetical protein